MTAAQGRATRPWAALALLFVIALVVMTWRMSRPSNSNPRAIEEAAVIQPLTAAPGELDSAENVVLRTTSTRVEGTVAVDDSTKEVKPAATQIGSILGTVSSADKKSATHPSGWVSLMHPKDPKPMLVGERFNTQGGPTTVAIDRNGRFEFKRAAFGEWILLVRADDFEPLELPIVVERSTPPTQFDLVVTPLRPTTLAVVLRHSNGINLFDAVLADELDAVRMLQAVFLAECPTIGADLPNTARRLMQKSRDVRSEKPDQWMLASFKVPTAGCACVLLGERVLDAVPFTAGQELVVLRVDPSTLFVQRCAIEVAVIDEVSGLPVADASVRITPQDGRERIAHTDTTGRARVEEMPVGEMQVVVRSARHSAAEKRVKLVASERVHSETISLVPVRWIRGSVRFPASGPVKYAVAAVRIGDRGRGPNASAWLSGKVESQFELGPLAPGEYMVGVNLPAMGLPVALHVRKGEVDGWCIVDVKTSDVDRITLDISEAVASELRAFDAKKDPGTSR